MGCSALNKLSVSHSLPPKTVKRPTSYKKLEENNGDGIKARLEVGNGVGLIKNIVCIYEILNKVYKC